VFPAPRGRGPYGITATPDGSIYYASFGGSYVGHVDTETGEVTVLEPPNQLQGARRIRSDSQGRIWVSEWNTGSVSMYNPANEEWQVWRVPSSNPRIYAVYVDEHDIVWLSDVSDNAIVRFDPVTEAFTMLPLPSDGSNVWQISGRPGEVWAAAARTDEILVIHTAIREEDGVGE
jgi:virginiamycin B lyase